MQKKLLNWTQQNRAYGGDTLMMSLQSGTDGQICHRHFSTTPSHHHVHRKMAHGPGDIPENHCGDPIQRNVWRTHTRKCLCPDSCHPQPCTTDPQYTKTIHLGSDFKTRSEQLKIYLLACGSNKCTCTYCVLLLYLERKLSSPTHPNKPPITY